MNLLERYLQSVSFFLPADAPADTIHELRDDLTAQFEDREAALGRPLTAAEQSDILRRFGHPIVIAGRYGARRHLIGPVFFPIYRMALKIGLIAAALVLIVQTALTATLPGDPVGVILDAVLAYPGRALMVFAWTTLGFAALDYAQGRLNLPRSWNPESLPPLAAATGRIPLTHSVAELVAMLAALIWLRLIPHSPAFVLGPAAAWLDPAPIWTIAYPALIALVLFTIALAVFDVIRPYWSPARSIARMALAAGSIAFFVMLLQAGDAVVAKPGFASAAVVSGVNAACRIGWAIAIAIELVELVREAHKARRGLTSLSPPTTLPLT